MDSPTEVAKEAVRIGLEVEANLTQAVDLIVSELVRVFPEGGILHAREVAAAVAEVRGEGACPEQTKNYTLYLFREHDHLCRHMVDRVAGVYRFHADAKCGPKCREVWERENRRKARPMSACCNIELTTAGTCPLCD